MPLIRNCTSCGKANRIPAKHLSDFGKCGACKAELPAIGEPLEVDEEQFDYWLDVLPPHYQRGYLFAFAEGAEPFRLFWRERGGRYFARQLTWDETRKFCSLSGASVPPRD